MIQRLVGICLMLGFSTASPIRKGAYAPAPPGGRPPCAAKSITFCEDVDKYPTKLIQTLLQSKSFGMYDFFTDESEGLEEPPDYLLHQEMTPPPAIEENIRKRRRVNTISEHNKFSRICPVQNKMATPKLASNRKGEWKIIAQDDVLKTQQKFKVQLCSDSEECQKSCTQFYTPVSMLSIDPRGKASNDIFWMPSTCRCFDDSDNMV